MSDYGEESKDLEGTSRLETRAYVDTVVSFSYRL